MHDIVQSLWVGGPLTVLEQLAIQSFLANGHSFHLYCYDAVDGVPAGTVVRAANEILDASRVFAYAEGFAQGSYAAFSNFFRYKLLLEKGGWWVDTDVVCLRPLAIEDQRVLATERPDPPRELIASTSVIKAQPADPLMQWLWEACSRMDTRQIRFGQIGPRLLQAGVDALGLHAFMRPHTFFSPVAFYDWRRLIDAVDPPVLPTEAFGLHLWNQMWSANRVDKSGSFPEECLYERLKRRYAAAPAQPQL